MITLDLTEHIGPKPTSWPDDMPNKIRLIEGKHDKEYEVHPMLQQTKWYKQLLKNTKKQYPYKRHDWPLGVSVIDLKSNAKIITT